MLESICGLRHEEYCGLIRSDIAYKKHNSNIEININKAVTAVNGHKIIKETKNKYSDRIVMLDKHFFQYFVANQFALTDGNNISDYTSPAVLTKNFRFYCRDNNLKYIPFRNMRSLYATLCSEAGCIDSVVSLSMGHTGNSIKQKNYQLLTRQALDNNARALAKYLGIKLTPLLC